MPINKDGIIEPKPHVKTWKDKSKNMLKTVPYISCEANSLMISMLYDDNYEIVNNEILELVDDSEMGLQEQLGYDDSVGIDPEIVFLILESLGTRKLTDLKFFLKKLFIKKIHTHLVKSLKK